MGRERTIAAGGTRGTVYYEVSRLRLDDSAVLLEQRRFQGAIYLAGYALECLLKYAVTRRRQLILLPREFQIHDLDILLTASGLKQVVRKDPVIEGLFSAFVDEWSVDLRYRAKAVSAPQAAELYNNASELYFRLDEITHHR